MKPAEAIITDFVLSASEDLPVSKRAELYRALARLTSNHETIGRLISLADELERINQQSQQLTLELQLQSFSAERSRS